MKPSERIRASANAQLAAHYHLERLDQTSRTAVSAAVMLAEVLTYLDEQHERDQLNEEVFTLALGALTGRTPELPPRAQEILAEIVAYPARNWSIPEPPDYAEALLRYWCERTGRAVP